MSTQAEHWKPVHLPEFADLYEVSTFGRVRKRSSGLVLKASPTGLHHHLQLKLRSPDGTTRNCLISHLVMAAFGEDPGGRPIGFHDKDPQNCAYENLYFLSATAANGGGHAQRWIARSIEEISARIWAELLVQTIPLLAQQVLLMKEN